ncbi:NUDIX hydrolase [Streptomyces roseolus]|uniref:NUDIX hydrolase n=1 Tax=Streptomyces roseolus TaxID=67358 RepID=UPI0037944EF0
MALFDETDRVLLLRHAAGRTPGLWDLPSGTISGREQPEDAARRVVTERTGLACTEVTKYTAALSGTSTAHHVFFARAAATELPAGLPPAYDGHVWRYADALPAVSRDVLEIVQAVAPPKPQLDPEEWQNTLPRWHVGANALVRDLDGRVLIVRPGRSRTWQLPGGQVDAHETPPQAAVRELYEETSLRLSPGPLLAMSFEHPSPGWDHPTQIMLFDLGVVDATAVTLAPQDPDIAECQWAEPAAAAALLGPTRAERLRAGLDAAAGGGMPALITATVPET